MPVNRSDFITRTPLEQVAFGLFLDDTKFAAKACCNVIPFDKAEKKIYQRDASIRRLVETKKATDAEANLVDWNLFSTNVTTDEHKLKVRINPRNVRDADLPDLLDETEASAFLAQQHLQSMEAAFAALAFTSGNYPTALTWALAAGEKWTDPDGNPELEKIDVDEALRRSCGRGANAAALDILTLEKLRLNVQFRNRTQFTDAAPVSDAMIKKYLGVEHLFVTQARYNTAVQGAAESLVAPFGDDVCFFVFDPTVGKRSQNAFVMGLINTPFWVRARDLENLVGAAGAMREVEQGTEYVFAPGFVESAASSKIAAAVLVRDVVG